MATLSLDRIADLLKPFLPAPDPTVVGKLSHYLDLLLKWNTRTNLTSVRIPEEIVTRHFGESLFAARHLAGPPDGDGPGTLLDFGSGAGFPGIPIALSRRDFSVTLAESQGKKASFLREAIRVVPVVAEILPYRVEDLPAAAVFDCVTLRAVDAMPKAVAEAARRARHSLLLLTTVGEAQELETPAGFRRDPAVPVPQSENRILLSMRRSLA